MEVILLIVVVAIFLTFRYARSRSGDGASRPPPPEQQSASIQSASITKEQPPAFDAGNATHLHDVRVLTGAAYITDGDTIKINDMQIRLFGIDAPELNHSYGKKQSGHCTNYAKVKSSEQRLRMKMPMVEQ